jgi:hypothetical protein
MLESFSSIQSNQPLRCRILSLGKGEGEGSTPSRSTKQVLDFPTSSKLAVDETVQVNTVFHAFFRIAHVENPWKASFVLTKGNTG